LPKQQLRTIFTCISETEGKNGRKSFVLASFGVKKLFMIKNNLKKHTAGHHSQ
jgi:hypothetical protein